MQYIFRTTPTYKSAESIEESAVAFVLPKPNFNLQIGFIILIITGLILAYILPPDKNEEEYFQELSEKRTANQEMSSGEKTDFCELMKLLRDSIPTDCVDCLDGINWDNPPKPPESLGSEWEELPAGKSPNTRKFRHKKYGIRINFDYGNPNASSKAHKSRDHWHRLNPNSRSKGDFYLDKNGNPVSKNHKDSHLHTLK